MLKVKIKHENEDWLDTKDKKESKGKAKKKASDEFADLVLARKVAAALLNQDSFETSEDE